MTTIEWQSPGTGGEAHAVKCWDGQMATCECGIILSFWRDAPVRGKKCVRCLRALKFAAARKGQPCPK